MLTRLDLDNNECVDYAAGKIALELCNHPQYMTADGDELEYGTIIDNYGYLGIHHPSNITLDLTQTNSTVGIRQISIKFMDPEDDLNLTKIKGQKYAYRILCSDDGKNWKVLYDTTSTLDCYHTGWVHFLFRSDSEEIDTCSSWCQQMRYFRIHALQNPANSGFHVVRLRIFNIEKSMPKGKEILLLQNESYDFEVNDTTPLATKLLNIAERLYRGTPDEYKTGNNTEKTDKFNITYNYIIEKAFELQAVDGKVDQVRKIVTPLIAKRMDRKMETNINSTRRELLIMSILFIIYIVVLIYNCVK